MKTGMESLEIEFDRITPQGMAAGPLPAPAQRLAVAWDALPGERALVLPLRRQHGVLLCGVEQILGSSPDRIPPREQHYLSCSPWQAMNYPAQLAWKRKILEDLFPGVGLEFLAEAQTRWAYRNKMEFSFTEEAGRLQLAFHQRGSSRRKVALPAGCALASEAMNQAALEILARLAERAVPSQALKSLIVRGSRASSAVLLGLYVMDPDLAERMTPDWLHDPPLSSSAGLSVFFSDPLSPASVPTRLLFRAGAQHLVERIAGIDLAFPLEGFFQNHAEVFERAVEEIRRNVPHCRRVVELYCGVGSIGLALSSQANEIVAIEENPLAVEFARRNRDRLGAASYQPREGKAQDVEKDLLASADVLVVDPPRSGLHPKLISAIVHARPPRILYLSCNPSNQARDIAMLVPAYRLVSLAAFDFYPQTPHVESLAVLDRL